jgi:hypothetical protein
VSDPTRTAPAGWYADPNGAPTLRWWDGTTWSEHYAPGAAITLERPRLTTDTKVDGVWIWLVAALPLVSIASYFLIDFRGYMQGLMTGDIRGALTVFGVGYFASLALSWITWGAAVLFAYFDWRDLRAAGVVRPFHWAWAFLGGIVYLIGRTVIVRKVSPGGLGPLWGGIAVLVLALIVSIAWTSWMMVDMMSYFPSYDSFSSYGSYS